MEKNEFTKILVEALTAREYNSYPAGEIEKVEAECRSIYEKFIIQYVKENNSPKESALLIAALNGEDEVFDKHPGLEGLLKNAHIQFFESIEQEYDNLEESLK